MRIPASHIERIQQLGCTESEARFLYIVEVFAGYFTMRQFRAFTGSRCGKRPACFAQKPIAQDHARVCAQVRNASLFRLFSRTFYGQMDKDNLRNRKRHSFEFVRTRLLILDFILVNLEFAYFESEQDKVNFFRNQLGISKDCLDAKPAKRVQFTLPPYFTPQNFTGNFTRSEEQVSILERGGSSRKSKLHAPQIGHEAGATPYWDAWPVTSLQGRSRLSSAVTKAHAVCYQQSLHGRLIKPCMKHKRRKKVCRFLKHHRNNQRIRRCKFVSTRS